MITDYKSNILFIEGVYMANCKSVEDMMEKQMMEAIMDSDEPLPEKIMPASKIPMLYTGAHTWVSCTNSNCWYCGMLFDTTPIFVPSSIEPTGQGKNIMGVEGCFCSFPCAASYINLHYQKPWDNINRQGMLKILYKELTGKKIDNIPPAPNKYKLVAYGGTMTPDEYRDELLC